jgi:hypothetical protein
MEPSDMPGIPRELAEHTLNVDPKVKPVQQILRRFSKLKHKAIGEEVNQLRKAGFIRKLKEAKWLANPVMVLKKDTTALRMCIDFTSLNKHCPKDHFPMLRIDQIVDSTVGCNRLSFLDAYFGYVQPNQAEGGRSGADCVYHTARCLLLQRHDLRFEECRRNVPAVHASLLRGAYWQGHRGLHR